MNNATWIAVQEMTRDAFGYEDIWVALRIRNRASRAAIKELVLRGRTYDRYADKYHIRSTLRVARARKGHRQDVGAGVGSDHVGRSMGTLPAAAGE